jgi:hypothetical protein
MLRTRLRRSVRVSTRTKGYTVNPPQPRSSPVNGLATVAETPGLIAREIQECLEDLAAEGLPLTIETQQVDVEVEIAA